MIKYYTRACNFYYGRESVIKVNKKLSLPLNGNKNISFDNIEIITRKIKKKVHIKHINKLNKKIKIKVKSDLKIITQKKKFKKLNLNESPILMGIVNLTPDSFSDGGKFFKKNLGVVHSKKLLKDGCKIIDLGGESTRPGAREISENKEWKRVEPTLKKLSKLNKFISLDTRKSVLMLKAIKYKINLINDVSGLGHSKNTISILKKTKIPFVINHTKGSPETMQKNPKYKNVLLDIYDFFEKKLHEIRKSGIIHNNILIDPGIGFGKNLKHNITLIRNISLFHTLGFPILLGISRKRFIKELSGINDTKKRIGGTISANLYAMMQGVQILRIHDVNEFSQSIKVFKSLKLI